MCCGLWVVVFGVLFVVRGLGLWFLVSALGFGFGGWEFKVWGVGFRV